MARLRVLMFLACLLAGLSPGLAGGEEKLQGEALLGAVVRVQMTALDDARTRETLGDKREGSGVVIDDAGHVLTIGYLVLEAAAIELTTSQGKRVPAVLAGYDPASGLAVLRPMLPLGIKPLPLGASSSLKEKDPALVLSYGVGPQARLAMVVSRRLFTGNWEYLLESAIFTSPPAANWSGAALIDREGRLVGVGSLLVRDSASTETPLPGNMFVPADLLQPILAELIRRGRPAMPARPWLGLTTEEVGGHLVITGVAPGGPAEAAGVAAGDIVVGVHGEAVRTRAELYRKVWGLGVAGTDVPLNVLQGANVRELKLRSVDRQDYLQRPPSY